MDIKQTVDINAASAWLIVLVKNGHLVIRTRLPLRWTLIVIGAVATATGYSTVVELVTKLLNAG